MRNIIALACALACVWPFARAGADESACKTKAIDTGSVRAVRDGRTLVLADGREVRLAGIETARGGAAQAALQDHVGNDEIELFQLGPATDRYGRVIALVRPAGAAEPVQITLLSQGLARMSGRVGEAGCAAEFRRAETAARAAGLGLWSDPSDVMQQAERPGEILLQRGRFTLVEGTVVSVRESGGTIYVNFGQRWSEDFTATVAKRHERRFAAAGMSLKHLTGQRVRVRGTVEERGGPWIELATPEQIEIAGH